MSFSWLNLKKSKNSSNLRSRFFAPELLALENRVNPTAFTADVFYNGNIIEVQLTSVGIGVNANTLKVSSIGSDIISINAGLGNTIQLTSDSSSSGLVPSTNPAQSVSIISPSTSKGLTLIGNVGQDKFTLGDFNKSTLITSTGEFAISIDTSSFSGANNQDTLTIDGSVRVIGNSGSFKTSNSIPTQNLDQIIITSLGQINADTGNILLVANQGGTSDIDISSRTDGTASLNTASGSVTFLAGQLINIEGKVVTTNGGSINFLSAVILKDATDLATTTTPTGSSLADITFFSTVDGYADLNVNSLGTLNFNGLVGSRTPLKNISTRNISGLNVNDNITADSFNTDTDPLNTIRGVNGNIVFNGLQTYNTTNGLNLVTSANGDITINGAITMVKPLDTFPIMATASALVNAGNIIKISVINSGAAYSLVPAVLISAPSIGGTQATATAVLGTGATAGQVVDFTITNPGTGYISPPEVIIAPPCAILNFVHSGALNINASITNGEFFEKAVGPNSIVNIGDTASVSIYSDRGITFNCPVFLKTNVSLEATNDSSITFGSTLDGPGSLSINCTGNLVFTGKVGSSTSVGSISTRLVGLLNFKTSDPSTMTFSDTLNVGSVNAMIQGNVSILQDQVYSGSGLSLVNLIANSTVELGKISSNASNASNVSISNAGTLNLTGDIIIGGNFSQAAILASITLTNSGSNYTSYPDVTIISNPADIGSGAFAKASLSISSLVFNSPATGQAILGTGANSGTLSSIVSLSHGSGYITPPAVTISGGGGTGAIYNANLGSGDQAGQVVSYTKVNGGSGYLTAPTITVDLPPKSGIGSGYALGDLVTLQGDGSTILTSAYAATAKVTGIIPLDVSPEGNSIGSILSLALLNPGKYDYLSSPSGLIGLTAVPITGSGSDAKLDATGFVNAVELFSSGLGYVSTPSVSFSGGNGSGAAAFASLITPIGDVFSGKILGTSAIKIQTGFASSITFTTKLNLNQELLLDSSTSSVSNITLGGVDGKNSSTVQNLTLIVGGSLQFNGTIGAMFPIGAIDASLNPVSSVTATSNCLGINASSFKFVSSGNVTLTCPQVYSGSLAADKSSFFGLDFSNTTSSSTVNLGKISTIGAAQVQSILVTNGGSFYTSIPTVTISPPSFGGVQATGIANIVNGVVVSISMTNFGSRYTTIPSITITPATGDVTGSGATAVAVLAKNSVRINNAGAVIFTGDINAHGDFIQDGIGSITFGDSSMVSSIGATATALLSNGTVGSLVSNVVGVGYNSVPDVTVSAPYLYQATAVAELFGATVSFIRPVFTSNFYNFAPVVIIEAPSGPGIRATAIAVLGTGAQAGQVVSYTVTNVGSGYLTIPKVIVAPASVTATATAILGSSGVLKSSVVGYSITNPGVGYIPPVTISGGGGSGAKAIAILGTGVTAGQVIGYTMIDVGSGYTSSPTVSIAPPLNGGTQATGTAVFGTSLTAGKIIGLTVTNPGFGYVPTVIVESPIIKLSTSGGDVSFKAGISLVKDMQIDSSNNISQSGNISFSSSINSIANNDLTLTSGPSALGLLSGDIVLKASLGISSMGNIIVNNPDNFSILGNVLSNSLVINGAGGSITFSGSLNTQGITKVGTDFVSLSIETTQVSGFILFQQPITAAGNVVINNSGSFITSINGDLISSGSFIQKGNGSSFLSGDITTTKGGISFAQSVNFTVKPFFNARNNSSSTSVADIIFLKDVNGSGGVSLEASGKIIFKENIGLLNSLSTIEIVNAESVEFNSLATQILNVNKMLLTNTKGTVTFFGKSNIFDTFTTVSNAYNVEFRSDVTVGSNANIFNNGNITFLGNTTFLGSAFFNNSGFLNLGGSKFSAVGPLNVQSKINLSTNVDLFLGSAGNTFGGPVISLSGVSLNLNKGSNLVLTANSPQFLGSIVLLGDSNAVSTLQIISSYTNGSIILNGGKLTGTGKVKEVQNVGGGIFTPGSPVGTFAIGKDLSLGSSNIFVTQIDGAIAGSFGQVSVAGLVNLSNASLNISSASNLSVGQKVIIINNGSVNSISGQFQGLVEGSSITSGPVSFTISYKGGSGNDVVLTVTNVVIPPLVPTYYAIGVDYGGGSVVQINYANGTNLSFFAYSPTYTGGVRVALGDVNGDGYNDLITGTGVGGGPHIKVYNLISGRPVEMASFFAFEPNFMGGVYVASGDINGDGFDDIIIGAGAGGGPRVKVIRGGSGYSMNSAVPLMDIFAFDPSFNGGVRVAAGNRDNVAGEEVITAAGYGGGPNIRSFSAVGQVIDNFFAFNTNINTGIFVGAGYVDGDGIADIIAGTGLGTPTQIAAFYSNGAKPVAVPFTSGFMGGASVGVALNSSGQQVFAAATGPGGSPVVCLFNNSLVTTDSFFAINPLFSGGLFLNTSL